MSWQLTDKEHAKLIIILRFALRFMFWTIYVLNRYFDVPKDTGSWKLEYDIKKELE